LASQAVCRAGSQCTRSITVVAGGRFASQAVCTKTTISPTGYRAGKRGRVTVLLSAGAVLGSEEEFAGFGGYVVD